MLLKLGFSQDTILSVTLLTLYINDLPDYIFCVVAIYGDDTALYFKYHWVFNLWQQPRLASELVSDCVLG